MSKLSRARVLLADDHALVREGTRRLIEAESDLEVVPANSEGTPESAYAPVKTSGGRRFGAGWFRQVSSLLAAARALF
jgi:hypothetical protein